ncbi:MAG: hypothetical protein H0X27_00715 [Caulobacteraceae bacterium]|nr:hypothetical protein [Caulobacteraceae bacterium]
MAGFKRVLLYAGAPKTGTTSIQTFLWSNRGALMKQGVYVPRTGRRGAQHMEVPATLHDGKRRSGLDRHADVRDDNLQERRSAFVRGLDEELARAPACHTLLFMSEYLFTSSRKEVRTYRKFFSRYAPRLESLMYLRRQDHWLASLTLQGRKAGTRDDLELTPGPPDEYGGAIRVWDVESYACHIRRFEREFLLNGDLIEDFCATIGAEPPRPAATEVRANPAIMQEQLELMDVLNQKLASMPFFRRIPYRRTFIAFCADVLGGTRIEFQRDAARAAFETYEEINSWLHHTRDPEGPTLFFNADFSDYPEVPRNGRQYTLKQLAQLKSVVTERLRDRRLAEPAVADLPLRYSLTDYIAAAFIVLRKAELRESRRALREARSAEERALGEELGFKPIEGISEFIDDDDDD